MTPPPGLKTAKIQENSEKIREPRGPGGPLGTLQGHQIFN